jgi:hypothetical protein
MICPNCMGDGRFLTECCDGIGGCSCGGAIVDMGHCRVCGGSGHVVEGQYDKDANRKVIAGLDFIGSGPQGMYDLWPSRGHMI